MRRSQPLSPNANAVRPRARSNNVPGPQVGDRRIVVAKLAQHHFVVLAALRRRRAQARWRPAQRHRLTDKVEPPEGRMLHRLRDADMLDLRIGEDLIYGVDRSAGHAGAVEKIDPRGTIALRRIILDRGIE